MRSWPRIAKVSAIPRPMLDICHPWYTARLNRCGQPKRPRSISDSISLQAGHLFLFDPCLVVFEWLCFWNVFWVTLLIDVNLLFMLRRRHGFGLTVLSRHDMGIHGGLQYHVFTVAVMLLRSPRYLKIVIITVVNVARDSITLRFIFGTAETALNITLTWWFMSVAALLADIHNVNQVLTLYF